MHSCSFEIINHLKITQNLFKMLKEFKYFLNSVITDVLQRTSLSEREKRKKNQKAALLKKEKEDMGGHALPSANIDYNDPVRKQLIQAKRDYAKQQKHDYSHVFR